MLPSPALEIRFPTPPGDPDLTDKLLLLLDDYGLTAVDEGSAPPDAPEGTPAIWRVHFASQDARDLALTAVRTAFGGTLSSVAPTDVRDDGWATRSQAALRAVAVGRLVVAPPWDVPDPRRGRIVVIVNPSTGFGTGHHATTRLCLRTIQDLDLTGRRVLDVGTGSGVLAVAAAKLGAARVLAIDCDPDALASAEESLALNRVGDRVTLWQADLADVALRVDVVLANLTAGVLVRHADRVRDLTVPGGTIVLGGILREQTGEVVAAFEADGTRRVDARIEEDGWVALTLVNRGPRDGASSADRPPGT